METDQLSDLIAREAIRQQLHNYCRAMDRRDNDLGYAVWHPDGTVDYGPGLFSGTARDFIDQVSLNHLTRQAHSHQIATIGIEVKSAIAASEAYVTVMLRTALEDGYTDELYFGRYCDRWSFRDGRWAIDHRRFILDCGELHRPVVGTVRPSGGSRDRHDPSYAVLESIYS